MPDPFTGYPTTFSVIDAGGKRFMVRDEARFWCVYLLETGKPFLPLADFKTEQEARDFVKQYAAEGDAAL